MLSDANRHETLRARPTPVSWRGARTLALGVACWMAASAAWPQTSPARTGAATDAAIWAPHPVGPQPLPDMPPVDVLEPIGDYPLTADAKNGCLLVARRGGNVVAVELTPRTVGPKVVGWTPKVIDRDTLASKWHYREPAWSGQAPPGNPATSEIAATSTISADRIVSNMVQSQTNASSSAKTWSEIAKDSKGRDVARNAASGSVTIDGKTYSRYTNFRAASADAPVAALDEYFCGR